MWLLAELSSYSSCGTATSAFNGATQTSRAQAQFKDDTLTHT